MQENGKSQTLGGWLIITQEKNCVVLKENENKMLRSLTTVCFIFIVFSSPS
jgi:hypothetical protein